MTQFETYHVHIYKPVTKPWSDAQEQQSLDLIDDGELCGLLEVVTTIYLAERGPLGRQLVVGAKLSNAEEMRGYVLPFLTTGLGFDILPMLRRMVAELDAMTGIESDEIAS